MTDQEQDFSKLPLEQRCTHKNWRARVSGYDELSKLFKDLDLNDTKKWTEYGSWVRKFPTDSNAAAQERALEVTLSFLENAAQGQSSKIVGEVVAGVVAKCVGVAKPKSKQLSNEIILMGVELEKYDTVSEELMKGMEHKNPKIVIGCINIMTEILKAFGPKVMSLKAILKKVPTLSEDRDRNVRDETKRLMVELYKWFGPAMKIELSGVKPIIIQEVETEVEKNTEKPKITRFLRSEQKRQQVSKQQTSDDNGNVMPTESSPSEAEIDLFEQLSPAEILSKINKEFYDKADSKKWQERKEALEFLEQLVNKPKLEPGEYSDVVRQLKKMIAKDSNVVIVTLAAKCLGGLASGLKKKFSPYAVSSISTILEKFKEKKPNVVAVLKDAIDSCFLATSLESICEEVLGALRNKNPAVKLETNSFLCRVFKMTSNKTLSDKKLMKPYFTAILETLRDSADAGVREAAAEAFGIVMKRVGESNVNPLLKEVDSMKLQKIKEYADKFQMVLTDSRKETNNKSGDVKATKSASITSHKSVSVATPVVSQSISKTSGIISKTEESSPVSISSSGRQVQKPPPSASPKAARKSRSSTSNKIKDPQASVGPNLPTNRFKSQRLSDEMKMRMIRWNFTTPRIEFVDLLKDLMSAAGFNETLIKNMFDSDFRMHIAAIDTLQEEFNLNPESTICNLDLILKWATLRFFDTNPSVLIRIMDYLSNVFSVLGMKEELKFNLFDLEASSFVPYLVCKLGDAKETIRSRAHNILRLICKVYLPSKVFLLILEGIKSKNAKQRADSLDELGFMISTYGMDVFTTNSQSGLKEIAKHISDRDQNVRNGSLNAIVQAYHLVGNKVYKMIGNLAPKDQSLLEERIKRVGKSRNPQTLTPITSKSSSNPASSRNEVEINKMPEIIIQPPLTPNTSADKKLDVVVEKETNEVVQPQDQSQLTYTSCDTLKLPAKTSILPAKYQIDFEAIDNQFDSFEPIPPLVLLDTNVDEFIGDKKFVIPKFRFQTMEQPITSDNPSFDTLPQVILSPSFSSIISGSNGSRESIDLLVLQLKDEDTLVAIDCCYKLESILKDYNKALIMAGRVERILILLAEQLSALQCTLGFQPSSEKKEVISHFFKAAVSLLSVLFPIPTLTQRATSDALQQIVYQLLLLLNDERVRSLKEAVSIIRPANVLIVRIFEYADPNAISCALIRLLKDAVTHVSLSNDDNTSVLDLVLRCSCKLLKQHAVWKENKEYLWDVKGVLSEFHQFVKEHPFSSFTSRNATALKTLKTMLHAFVFQVGNIKVRNQLNLMPELNNSTEGDYLKKIIQKELQSSKKSDLYAAH